MVSGPWIACGCTSCVLLIIGLILLILGWSRLEVNEVGIDYSANSLTIDTSKLYSNGLHFIGVGHSFIKYPKRQLEISMTGRRGVIARTNDGLVVTLETKMLYSLDTDINALASLYLMFKEDYTVPIENICRSVIRDVASEFTAFQFWTNRSEITAEMSKELRDRLDDIFVNVETFLLSSYNLPSSFQTVIDTTEVQRQEMNKVQFELERVAQETQALILKAEEQVLQINTVTRSTVQTIALDATAEVYKLDVSISNEIQGYKNIKETLNMTVDELTAFIWLEKMSQSPVAKTIAVRTPNNLLL